MAQLGDVREVIDRHVEAIREWLQRLCRCWLPKNSLGKGGVQQMQFRRRVPRQPAGWDGVCQIEGEFAARCRVIDISMLGVGITLDHPSPYALVGRHISVDVPAVGDSASIRLEGKVTNAKLTLRTTVRVGIEFDNPSPELVSKVGGHARAGARRVRVR